MDYTIKQGDNISSIAQNNNTTIDEIVKLNKIADPNKIFTGQVIKLGNTPTTNTISVDGLQNPQKEVEIPLGNQTPQVNIPIDNEAQKIIDAGKVAETESQKQSRELSQKLTNLLPQTMGETQALQQAQEQVGVNNLNKNLNDINSQILMKQAELAKDDVSLASGIANIEDKPIAMEFITGQQASLQRQAQIARAFKNAEINTLNARAVALQGNIELAKSIAQQAVDAKYAPVKELINVYSMQLKALEPILTADEKKVAREQEIRTTLAMNEIKEKQEDEKKIQELIINASSQGAPSSLISSASLAKTPVEVAKALGMYAGDRLERLIKEAQLQKLRNDNIVDSTVSSAIRNGIMAPKATEGQITSTNFALRMKLAENILTNNKYKPWIGQEGVFNFLKSEDRKSYEQAQDNFITAVLRKESGASIAPSEFDTANKIYFPQVGDTEDIVKQKENLRKSVQQNFANAGGEMYRFSLEQSPDIYTEPVKIEEGNQNKNVFQQGRNLLINPFSNKLPNGDYNYSLPEENK